MGCAVLFEPSALVRWLPASSGPEVQTDQADSDENASFRPPDDFEIVRVWLENRLPG
jgi:hypothetical protein